MLKGDVLFEFDEPCCKKISLTPFEILDKLIIEDKFNYNKKYLKMLTCVKTRNADISELENLEMVIFYDIPKTIKSISNNVKEMNISNTEISVIPSLPNLKNLNCSFCPELRSIPTFDKLEILDISYCNDLRFVASQPSLISLECFGNFIFLEVEELEKVNNIHCNYIGGPIFLKIPEDVRFHYDFCDFDDLKNEKCLNCRNLDYIYKLGQCYSCWERYYQSQQI